MTESTTAVPPIQPREVKPFIVKETNYRDEKGAIVIHAEAVRGVLPPDFPEFMGTAVVQAATMPSPAHPSGVIRQQIRFRIPARDIFDAFFKFETFARIEMDRLKQAQEHAAREAAAPLLVGSDGRALKG